MNEFNETFFINKCSSMSFKQLGEFISDCFKYLENPQNHLQNVRNIPTLKGTYDGLIELLESKLIRLEKLLYCKNELKNLRRLNIEMGSFNTLVDYYRITENDKKKIEIEIESLREKIQELMLTRLKCLFFKSKTALGLLNTKEPLHKIFNVLSQLAYSDKEIKNVLENYDIRALYNLSSTKFQFTNVNKEDCERIADWIDVNKKVINLQNDLLGFCNKNLSWFSEIDWWREPFSKQNEKLKKHKEKEGKIKEIVDFVESTADNKPALKFRVHRALQIRINNSYELDEILFGESIQKRLNKLLEIEESFSNSIIRQNCNSEVINNLFNEYKSKRDMFISTINSDLENIKKIIPIIEKEIEKLLQIEEIDSNLESSKRILDGLKQSKKHLFKEISQSMIIKEIFWDLLPQGKWKTEDLIKTFKGYGWSKNEFDESRLTQIINILKPTICYIGKEKFQGYVVFGFNFTEKVVLECPKYGNAIYIIKGNWQEITKLSKWEARQLSQVTVIRHSNTWFKRLKENLGRNF